MNLINRIKENAYLIFVSKLTRFFVILFVLDFTIGHVLKYSYFNQKVGRHYRSTYSIEETRADILIFGSSKAYNHYVPEIFESRLRQSCYNTASAGQFILYHYASLKAILNRYTPKIVIIDIFHTDLRVERDSYERLSFLLPYYKRDTAIQSVVDLKGPYEKYKLVSSIYPYNSSILVLAASNTEYYKSRNKVENGYFPQTGIWSKPIQTVSSDPYPLDSVKINIFRSFITDCQKAGTKLICVASPSFINFERRESSEIAQERIAKEHNILFLDFTNDPFFINRPYLFSDPLHLNEKGSREFTNILIDKITGN